MPNQTDKENSRWRKHQDRPKRKNMKHNEEIVKISRKKDNQTPDFEMTKAELKEKPYVYGNGVTCYAEPLCHKKT